jgi:hypothetical protein
MRTGTANEANPVAHESLARRGWSGTVTPREGEGVVGYRKTSGTGREHVVIGSWYRGIRTIEGREFDLIFRCYDMGGSKQ